jgi:Sensors of blue-light using FAD
MSAIWQVLYRSDQAYEMDAADLVKLLLESRTYNGKHDITGLLLYRGGQFMQLLEGSQPEVQRLFRKIATDPRHHVEVVEVDAPAGRRLFPDWRMGFAEAPEMDGHPAFAGVESERDVMTGLSALASGHMPAMRLMRFLGGRPLNGAMFAVGTRAVGPQRSGDQP